MNWKLGYTLALLMCALLVSCGDGKNTKVHYNAFSHNDEMRENPLIDALNYGFNCVEADAHLIDGRLYVAHDYPEDISKLKTLEELYLQPLFKRVKDNGGSVYPHSAQPFYLMVDIKGNGEEFYAVLKPFLESNKEMFCAVENGEYKEGPILLFFSGDRPVKSLSIEDSRLAFLDGTFGDLNKSISHTLMPIVSDNFSTYFHWNGNGLISGKELQQLRFWVKQAHAEGKKIRFWGGPNTNEYQQMQLEEGVDMIGTDDLAALHQLLSVGK